MSLKSIRETYRYLPIYINQHPLLKDFYVVNDSSGRFLFHVEHKDAENLIDKYLEENAIEPCLSLSNTWLTKDEFAGWSTLTYKWVSHFISQTNLIAKMSEDTSKQVGAVIVSRNKTVLSSGYNGIPRGCILNESRLTRPNKYSFFEHAERNALYNAARNGIKVEEAMVFSSFFPCADCVRGIIQSGIKGLVTPPPVLDLVVFNYYHAIEMLKEAGVGVLFYREGVAAEYEFQCVSWR